MHELRAAFAEVYPPAAPEFHYHWLTFARTAIAEDKRRGRYVYPISGTISKDYDPMVGDPIILPGKAIFHDSKESFYRALGKKWETSSGDSRPGDSSIKNSRNTISQRLQSSEGRKDFSGEVEDSVGEDQKSGKLLDRIDKQGEGESISKSYIPIISSPNL